MSRHATITIVFTAIAGLITLALLYMQLTRDTVHNPPAPTLYDTSASDGICVYSVTSQAGTTYVAGIYPVEIDHGVLSCAAGTYTPVRPQQLDTQPMTHGA